MEDIMGDIRSIEFAVKVVFDKEVYLEEFTVFIGFFEQ